MCYAQIFQVLNFSRKFWLSGPKYLVDNDLKTAFTFCQPIFQFFRLKDSQILANLLDVCAKEKVEYTEDGLEAVVFTAQVRLKKFQVLFFAEGKH